MRTMGCLACHTLNAHVLLRLSFTACWLVAGGGAAQRATALCLQLGATTGWRLEQMKGWGDAPRTWSWKSSFKGRMASQIQLHMSRVASWNGCRLLVRSQIRRKVWRSSCQCWFDGRLTSQRSCRWHPLRKSLPPTTTLNHVSPRCTRTTSWLPSKVRPALRTCSSMFVVLVVQLGSLGQVLMTERSRDTALS